MHAEREAAGDVKPDLELDLVAVMPFAFARDTGGHVRLDPCGVHVRNALERVDDGLTLPAQLSVVGEAGPRATAAATARGLRAQGLHAIGGLLDEPRELGTHEALVDIDVFDLAYITGKCPRHEGDASVGHMADAVTTIGERFDGNCLDIHALLSRHDEGLPKEEFTPLDSPCSCT